MKTIVTFTGNRVRILCGDATKNNITVNKVIDVPFSMNCVMNGVITDSDIFLEGIKSVWNKYNLPKKGVVLSVDGNHIKAKKLVLPRVSQKKLQEIVSSEFLEAGTAEGSLVSSYIIMEQDKAQVTVIGFSAEKAYVVSLAEIFSKLGVRLSCVTSSRCGIINVHRYIDAVRDKNCIIQSLNGEILSSILVEKGKYVTFSSVRIFSSHETESFGAEVSRNVSQLLQFQSAERSENPVTDVYYIGFSDNDYKVSANQVALLNLKSALITSDKSLVVNGSESVADCFEHAGVFALEKNGGNLYREIFGGEEKRRDIDRKLTLLLPILCIVAVFSVISSILITSNNSKAKELNALTSYVNDESNISKEAEYNDYVAKSAAVNAKLKIADDIKTAIESYPYAVSALGDVIASCGEGIVEVTITSYDAASGNLSFSSTGKNADKLNEFIEALTNTGIFYNITYSGYAMASDGNNYNVNVSCTLVESAGK